MRFRLVRLELILRRALHVVAAKGKHRREFGRSCTARFVHPHNVITLSCKAAYTCRPHNGMVAAAIDV